MDLGICYNDSEVLGFQNLFSFVLKQIETKKERSTDHALSI